MNKTIRYGGITVDFWIIKVRTSNRKGWLAIAKLKPLLLFISLSLRLKKAFDNVEKEKWKVKVVLALQWLASPFERIMIVTSLDKNLSMAGRPKK